MSKRAWGMLIVLCGAIFIEGTDVAMLNVALPSIRADLGLSTGMLSGVVSAYVLGSALLVPLAATAVAALIMATGLRRRRPTPAYEADRSGEPEKLKA